MGVIALLFVTPFLAMSNVVIVITVTPQLTFVPHWGNSKTVTLSTSYLHERHKGRFFF